MAVNHLENGDMTNFSDEEVKMVDDFVKDQFPNGFIMNIDWDNDNEFNSYPTFGGGNEHALTNKGESPYLATKTFLIQFLDSTRREPLQDIINEDGSLVAEQHKEDFYSRRGR